MEESLKKIKLCPEVPIKSQDEDLLGFKDAVEKLCDVLDNIEAPFTLGIYGAWGSGKTSFMRLMEERLKAEDSFSTFWFDAWQYENESSLMMPLLTKLAAEHEEDPKLKEAFDSVLKVGAVTALTGAGGILKLLSLGSISPEDIIKNFEMYEEKVGASYKKWVSEIDTLKDEFASLVDKLVDKRTALVIFIDDLDRCLPENTVKLIENIKHYLFAKKCIFVFGVDKHVIAKGIEARYGTQLISGDEYLDKIVNLSFEIPDKTPSDIEEYIIETAKKMSDPEWFESIKDNISLLGNTMIECQVRNVPRKLNIIVKRYLFFHASSKFDDVNSQNLALVLILKEFFPSLYEFKEKTKILASTPEAHGVKRDIEKIKKDYGDGLAKDVEEFNSVRYQYLRSQFKTKEPSFGELDKCHLYFQAINFIYSLS